MRPFLTLVPHLHWQHPLPVTQLRMVWLIMRGTKWQGGGFECKAMKRFLKRIQSSYVFTLRNKKQPQKITATLWEISPTNDSIELYFQNIDWGRRGHYPMCQEKTDLPWQWATNKAWRPRWSVEMQLASSEMPLAVLQVLVLKKTWYPHIHWDLVHWRE